MNDDSGHTSHSTISTVRAAKITAVTRFLIGRIAADRVRTALRLAWLLIVSGGCFLLIGPLWFGVALLTIGVGGLAVRTVLVWIITRTSLAPPYRPVEEQLLAAVEAGKPNIRRELRRAGLPSSAWQMPMLSLRLAFPATRTDALNRLSQIDLDRVLPVAQIERARRLLGETSYGPAHSRTV